MNHKKNISEIVNSAGQQDARTGLGYGQLNPTKQLPRQMQGSFPYTDEDQIDNKTRDEENEYEDSDVTKMQNKMGRKLSIDPLAASGTDPFYFVGGNTKLSDCFRYPDKVLLMIEATGKSLVPVPGMYAKNFDAGIGGSSGAAFPSGVGNFKRTGSKAGFSSPPPPSQIASERETSDEFFSLEDFANLEDEKEEFLPESLRTAYLQKNVEKL